MHKQCTFGNYIVIYQFANNVITSLTKKDNIDVLLDRQMSLSVTRRVYNWCPLCGYQVRKNREPSKLHHKVCLNLSFLPFGYCRVCSQEHHQIDPTIVTSSRFCSVTFSNYDINGRTGSDYIPKSSVNVSFPKENDNFTDGWWDIAAIEEQEKTIHID